MHDEEFDYSQEWVDAIIKSVDDRLFGRRVDNAAQELEPIAGQLMQTAHLKRGRKR